MKKVLLMMVGCAALALGALGTVLPVLPTVPFFLLATICFAKSSEKLHRWFVGTKLYQDNLADYVAGKGMTTAAKRRIMGTVTLLMAFGFAMMLRKGLYMPCILLASVWVAHILYFVFGIKTAAPAEA